MKNTQVIYGWYGDDNDPAEYTKEEREKFFKQEGKKWREWFFTELERHGRVRTNFAIYTLENVSPFPS